MTEVDILMISGLLDTQSRQIFWSRAMETAITADRNVM